MRNYFVLFILFLISFSTIEAKKLTVIRSNGRKHWFSDKITYRSVREFFTDGELTRLECMGHGPEDCPKVGVVTAGYFNGTNGISVSADEIIAFAEKQFERHSFGKAFYKGVFLAWKNAKKITFEDGKTYYEYQLYISDEVKNVRGIGSLKF